MTTAAAPQLAYTRDQAAALVAVSVGDVTKGIRSGRLCAKNVGTDKRPRYRITHKALVAWVDGMDDA